MVKEVKHEMEASAKGSSKAPDTHITGNGKGRYAFVENAGTPNEVSGMVYLGTGFQPINLTKFKVIVIIPE